MYEFVEHTGELAIKVRAKSLPDLFTEAARAMCEYLVGVSTSLLTSPQSWGEESPSPGPEREQGRGRTERESITLSAPDQNALLVAWLSEILYRIETKHKIYTEFKIDRLAKSSLSAKIGGVPIKALRTDIKAVTHHGLKIEKQGQEYKVVIIFDV